MFKFDLNEDEAFHLNVGVPIVLGLIFLLINLMFFEVKFLEPIYELVFVFANCSFLVLLTLFFLAEKKKNKKRNLTISLYNLFFHNALLTLFFLITNLIFSHHIYETSVPFNQYYNSNIDKLNLPVPYQKMYSISKLEYDTYYKKGFELQVIVDESFLGYQFIKKREFVKQ